MAGFYRRLAFLPVELFGVLCQTDPHASHAAPPCGLPHHCVNAGDRDRRWRVGVCRGRGITARSVAERTRELAFLVGLQRPSAAVWAIEVAVVCGLCALAAGLPAHRVTEIAPMIALRAD